MGAATPPGPIWLAYQGLLCFLCLLSLIGALLGRSGDWLMLLMVANAILGLHGWRHQIGYFRPSIWRALFVLDLLALTFYGWILVSDSPDSAPSERIAMLVVIAVVFGPMLYALRRYGWHCGEYWE